MKKESVIQVLTAMKKDL
ncbi:unnamed protein product [Euphydryas editha]|uniref:Uncharacterized protein n=1 Tax=Euphydryas editha TaxID=104508 RepID=A0AAU9USX1_EUPED|nr:unnamed protein product [Euphydryas editha]